MRVLLAPNMAWGYYCRKDWPDLAIDRIVTPGMGLRAVVGLRVTEVLVISSAAHVRGFVEVYEELRVSLRKSGRADAVEWLHEERP